MKKLWGNVRTTIAEAVRGTPIEVLLIVVVCTLFSVEIACAEVLADDELARFTLAALLGFGAIFATSAAGALKVFDARVRWALTGVALVASGLYGAFVLDVELHTEIWRWSFLAVAMLMGVMLVPVAARLGGTSASERFWRYNIRLFSRVAVSYAYGFLLFAGIAAALAAIGELFDLPVQWDDYAQLFVWVAVALGSVLAVGSLGEIKRIGEPFTPGTLRWTGRLGTFLFMPLVLLYLGIMYVYLGKVVVSGELPSNVLSPLALGAGMLGYFGLFVLQPHMGREDFKPLAKLLRVFPMTFLPIVPFGIYAVWLRIGQYGWTEFRYARMAALVALGVFSVVGAYRWIRKQEFSLVTGPAILGIMALLGAVGPWGASNVAMLSQVDRLETALAANDLLDPSGRLVAPAVVKSRISPHDAESIRTSTQYLLRAHGPAALADLTDVDLTQVASVYDRMALLGITEFPVAITTCTFEVPYEEPYRLEGGGIATDFSLSRGYDAELRGFTFRLEGTSLTVSGHGARGVANLGFAQVQPPFTQHAATLDPVHRNVPIVTAQGELVGTVSIRNVTFEVVGEAATATYLTGFVQLR